MPSTQCVGQTVRELFAGGSNRFTKSRPDEILSGDRFNRHESIQEFRDSGMYLSYQIPKDGNDRSTDLIVRTEFAGGTDVSQMNVLMFEHFRMFAEIKIRGGQIVSVVPRYN